MSKAKPKRQAAAAPPQPLQDLVVLAADKDAKEALDGLLLTRAKALRIRPPVYTAIVHPQHDPGCLNQSAGLLAVYHRTHRHALVVFDHEGSGREGASRIELEQVVEAALAKAGWDDRAAAIVIEPELEAWVWGPSPHVASCLGWGDPELGLRDWLVENAFLAEATQLKPSRPKEAMEAVLRAVKRPRSSAIFRSLAEKVGLSNCPDPAFGKLREVLRAWFPAPGHELHPDHSTTV